MTVVITDAGIVPDDCAGRVLPLEALKAPGAVPEALLAVDLPNDRDPAELLPWFDRLAMIRIAFPAMGDGRGFSLAQRLRDLGFRGRLRAAGPLIADQMDAALRVGFDEVEVPDSLAARQPPEAWGHRRTSYRRRLLG